MTSTSSAEANNSTPNPRTRRAAPPAPRAEWDEWYAWFRREWKQDQHISVIGPSDTGKSTLMLQLLRIRRYVVFIVTKPKDPKIESRLASLGYVRVPVWPKHLSEDVDRYLLFPPGAGDMSREGMVKQRVVIRDALQRIFRGPRGGEPGRWCVCIDEARYVADPAYLGLKREINQLLIQGRSLSIATVLGFQRPAWVPPEAYDQPSYLFIAQDNDRRNALRFREIGGVNGDTVAATIANLRQYEWAFIDARPGHGEVVIVQVPKELA